MDVLTSTMDTPDPETPELLLMSLSDDECIFSPPPFTPPPVPPEPPPPPFSRTAVTKITNGVQREVSFSNYGDDPVGDGQRAHKYAGSLIPDSLDGYTCISYQRKVEPILQSGPQCGLVALAMADSILDNGVDVEKLSAASQKKGFSKQGEIFSSHYLEILSAEAYGCKTSVLDIRDVGGKWEFINCLSRGDLLLVPYDPDKNYVPVLKKGHKAHWALVTGFFAAIKDENVLNKLSRVTMEKDSTIGNLYHCDSPPLPPNTPKLLPVEPLSTPRALSANVPVRQLPADRAISARTLPAEPTTFYKSFQKSYQPSDVMQNLALTHPPVSVASSSLVKNPLESASYILVYAKQGKSKFTGIWNAKTLVESCCNLIEVDPERLQDGDNYTIPENGIAEEMCGKVVVLHNKL